MDYLEGYYWATYNGHRDIWLAVGSDYEGGEQNFQCAVGGDVVKMSELEDMEKINE